MLRPTYYLSTLFTVKDGTNNKTKLQNISIKSATTITQYTQNSTMTPTTKATVAMTIAAAKMRVKVKAEEKL